MQKQTYRFLILGIMSVLLTIGTIIGYNLGKDIAKSGQIIDVPDFEITDNSSIIEEVISKDINIKKEYIIIKEIEYVECGHTNSIEDIIISDSIDNALKDLDKDYEIISKATNGAVTRKKINSFCPNHFIITIKDDYVVVYRKISENEKDIYLDTEIPINILRDDLLEDLNKGMEVEGIENLNKIIQEIES